MFLLFFFCLSPRLFVDKRKMKSFDEVLASICVIFEQDFDELIDQCFDKLDA